MARVPGGRFAHLAGLSAAAAVDDDDDEKEKDAKAKAKAEDDEDAKAKAAEDDKDEEKKDAKASDEDDEDKKEDASEGDEDEDEDKPKGKAKGRAKAKAKSESAIRAEERARCAAIIGHPSAAANIELAAELATGTDLPVSAAVALLRAGARAVPAAAMANHHADREARNPNIGNGAAPTASSAQASAAAWDAAMSRFGRSK